MTYEFEVRDFLVTVKMARDSEYEIIKLELYVPEISEYIDITSIHNAKINEFLREPINERILEQLESEAV